MNINWYSINCWHPQYFFIEFLLPSQLILNVPYCIAAWLSEKRTKSASPGAVGIAGPPKNKTKQSIASFSPSKMCKEEEKKTHSTSNESSLTSWRVPARVTTVLISYRWRRPSLSQRCYFSVASKRLQLDFQTDFSDPTDPWWRGTRNSWFIPSLATNTTWKIKIVNIEASDPVLGSWIIIITAQPQPVFSLRVSLWSHCPKCCIFLNKFLRLPFFSFFLPCPSICLSDAPRFPQEMVMGS